MAKLRQIDKVVPPKNEISGHPKDVGDKLLEISIRYKLYRKNDDFDTISYYLRHYVKNIMNYFPYIRGFGRDDVYQECLLAIIEAIDSYKKNEGCSFISWARRVIRCKLITLIQQANHCQYLIPLNKSCSLDIPIKDNNDVTTYYKDTLLHDYPGPAQIVESYDNIDEYIDCFSGLSKFEEKVARSYLKHQKMKKVAEELNIKIKSVDNTLLRIRKKMRGQMPKTRRIK